MRKLITALVILLLSVAAALWLQQQGGLVIISAGGWTLQTSLLMFVIIVVGALVALYLLSAIVRALLGIAPGVAEWRQHRRERKVRRHFTSGLLRLAEGRGADAEKLLTKDVNHSDTPLLHYLGAAIAAQREGSYEKRDEYLAAADKASPNASLAVGLMQAQLQIESRQWEQALATLSYLHENSPNHPRVLALLIRACEALDEWERIDMLLPAARRQHAIDDAEARRLERAVALHRLNRAAQQDPGALETTWNSLAKPLRQDPELLRSYVDGLAVNERGDDAERILRAQIGKEYDPQLVRRYGALEVSAPEKALSQVEKWLQDRPEDPVLLQAAGRLALQAKVWGRARSYLEAAAARLPDTVTLHLLGSLLEQMGETDAARERYRAALEQATSARRAHLTKADQRALAQIRANALPGSEESGAPAP